MIEQEINVDTWEDYHKILKSLSTNTVLKINGKECHIKTAYFTPPFHAQLIVIFPKENIQID